MRPRDLRRLLPVYRRLEELEKQIRLLITITEQHNEAFMGQYQINKHLITATNRIESKWN